MKLNEKKKKAISELLGQGYTAAKVADILGIHRVTVQRYRKELRGDQDGKAQ